MLLDSRTCHVGFGTSDAPRSVRPRIPHEGLVARERSPQGFAKGQVGLGQRRMRSAIRSGTVAHSRLTGCPLSQAAYRVCRQRGRGEGHLGQHDCPPKIDLARCRHRDYRYPSIMPCIQVTSQSERLYYTDTTLNQLYRIFKDLKPCQEEKQLFGPCRN
jgi:hypothetical protein